MDMLFLWITVFALLGGVLSVVLAAGLLLFPDRLRQRLLPNLVSYAIGSLLGAAFLALIPHALTSPGVTDAHDVMIVVLFGILAFFILEKLVLWRHCHHDDCEAHGPGHDHDHGANHHGANQDAAAARLILIGDGMHNLMDGFLIAAAFMTDIHLGVVTAVAVIAHEIPQEVGDFAILLNGGFSRARALAYNIASSVSTLVGAWVAYFSLQVVDQATPYVLAVAAASFIYIAVADLIPGLHRRVDIASSVRQVVLILAGVLTIFLAHSTLH